MSMYDGIATRLDAETGDRARMTFAEVSALVDGGLPTAAYEQSAWWANDGKTHTQAKRWMGAGWHTEDVDLAGQRVTFVRDAAPDRDPTTDTWDGVIHWAQRFADSIDFDAQERTYKVDVAERLADARTALLAGASDWVKAYGDALKASNLLNWRFVSSHMTDVNADPDAMRSILARMWDDEAGPEQLTGFGEELRTPERASRYSPGNVTALGSLLLMARDHAAYPPYRPTPLAVICRLVGRTPPADSATPAERHKALLDVCDEFLERTHGGQIRVRDRLDAQGILWAVAQYDPPPEWDAEEGRAFLHWRGDLAASAEDNDSSTTQRAWLVRGSSVNGRDLVPTWLAQGSMSLAASRLREVEAGMSRTALKSVIEEDYAHASYSARAEHLDEFHHFLTRMQIGDIVVTTSQGRLYVGTIAGEAAYTPSSDGRSNLRRAVDWADAEGIDYVDLPNEIGSRLQAQRDVVDLTQQIELVRGLLDASVDEEDVQELAVDLTLPSVTDELAGRLHVDREWLQESVELLDDRPQLIFYGPPGTGKTYIAQALASHLAGDNVKLVQFHPSYSYEDFFEGYRPVPGDGGRVGFELKAGPLRALVDQAEANPSSPYVLIVDEINRGNLAKIFGELYFLLEYRDRSVDLLYASGDDKGFTLPRNVLIIGTMNTADRSIALVDAAMRRRFSFVSLHPSEPPVGGVLRSWLGAEGYDVQVADLLDELNRRIEDPDFKIGPSYFMRPAVHKPGGLERVWRTSILPLLVEHHYGEGIDIEKLYGLDRVRASVAPAVPAPGTVADADVPAPDVSDDAPPPAE